MKVVSAIWARTLAEYQAIELGLLQGAKLGEALTFRRCNLEQFDPAPSQRDEAISRAAVLAGHDNTDAVVAFYAAQGVPAVVVDLSEATDKKTKAKKSES